MKNAHLRFGHLTYTKVFKKTSTNFKLPLDRFIGESELGAEIKAHLISVVGGDTQIAAVSAAIANGDRFTVEDPDRTSFRVSLGAHAECYRGSLQLEGQKRSLRHLVAVSQELAQTGSGTNTERTIILQDSAHFLWASLAQIHGLPGTADWSDWLVQEMNRLKAVRPLLGIGCSPVLVKGSKGFFMNCISRGLREGRLPFPECNGPIQWSRISLPELLASEAAGSSRTSAETSPQLS